MRILDRYVLFAFLVNYLLALSVLLGMYVLFDLIVNVQDFARGASTPAAASASLWDVVTDMADYYIYQLPMIFQLVSGIIPLVAAGFTMVRLTRHHELTAMLASGVSLYRVAAPIILASMALAILNICNQEFLISQPFMIDKLMRSHKEVNVISAKNARVNFVKESDQSLLTTREFFTLKGATLGVRGPSTFTRPAGSGSFLADKIRRDMVIVTSGFSNAANNGTFIVTDVSETSLSVASTALVTSPPAAVNVEAHTVVARNDPLHFVKDSDGSLLSAREYYPLTRVNVSVAASNTISRPPGSGSFLADGVRKNQVIETTGFSNPSNNGRFTVLAVDNHTITVAGTPLVPEAASEQSTLHAGGTMIGVFIVYRRDGMLERHTLAETAHWEVPPDSPNASEAWVLRNVVTEDSGSRNPDARRIDLQVRNTTTLQPRQIDLILKRKALDYLSSSDIRELAISSPEINQPLLYKMMHLRITQPLMNLIILLIGIPFLLTREPNRLIVNMFYCVAVTGVVFVATFVMFQMAGTQIRDPLLGTWLPVLIFGPFALVMLDFVQT